MAVTQTLLLANQSIDGNKTNAIGRRVDGHSHLGCRYMLASGDAADGAGVKKSLLKNYCVF